jgi:hypothetical protein
MTEELEQLIRRRLNILWHLASTKPRTERVRLIELETSIICSHVAHALKRAAERENQRHE